MLVALSLVRVQESRADRWQRATAEACCDNWQTAVRNESKSAPECEGMGWNASAGTPTLSSYVLRRVLLQM